MRKGRYRVRDSVTWPAARGGSGAPRGACRGRIKPDPTTYPSTRKGRAEPGPSAHGATPRKTPTPTPRPCCYGATTSAARTGAYPPPASPSYQQQRSSHCASGTRTASSDSAAFAGAAVPRVASTSPCGAEGDGRLGGQAGSSQRAWLVTPT
ncbi:hypothetical protein C2845_PM11G25880 [Panicum miliaceum]|uniref:Uncharacterized protein n=1 Tax=Panicum miliaceum TaxID=4540 RepID=A0A3L6RRV9_PANMI|nr:hypothetical protein C2845_PM11G25880 [Panicum miliaceum]